MVVVMAVVSVVVARRGAVGKVAAMEGLWATEGVMEGVRVAVATAEGAVGSEAMGAKEAEVESLVVAARQAAAAERMAAVAGTVVSVEC